MVTGRLPFDAPDVTSFFVKHLKEPPLPIRRLVPDVPESVASLVEQWSATTSRNEPYRQVAPAAWLADLSEEDLSWLASQDDGRDVVLYARAHRAATIRRFLPVS